MALSLEILERRDAQPREKVVDDARRVEREQLRAQVGYRWDAAELFLEAGDGQALKRRDERVRLRGEHEVEGDVDPVQPSEPLDDAFLPDPLRIRDDPTD